MTLARASLPSSSTSPPSAPPLYGARLSRIHHEAFGDFARESAPGILAMLRTGGIDRGRVLDLGCGSGILARELSQAGYEVVGVDISGEMLSLARSVAPAATFIRASLFEFEPPRCAAVLAIGEGITYLPHGHAPDVRAFVRRIHDALEPGGVLLFDVVLLDEANPMRYRREMDGEGWRLEVEVWEDPAERRLTRRIRIVDTDRTGEPTEERHVVQTFMREELEQMLLSEGFQVRVRRAYGARRLPPRRAAFIARKAEERRPR